MVVISSLQKRQRPILEWWLNSIINNWASHLMNLSPTLHLAHKDFKNWRSNLLPTGLNLKWVDWTCSVSDLFGSFKMILPPLQPKNPLGQERVFLTNPMLQKRLESALKWLKTGHKIIYGLQTGEASAKYAEASQVCRAGRIWTEIRIGSGRDGCKLVESGSATNSNLNRVQECYQRLLKATRVAVLGFGEVTEGNEIGRWFH